VIAKAVATDDLQRDQAVLDRGYYAQASKSAVIWEIVGRSL
jgi:hypothetical protein